MYHFKEAQIKVTQEWIQNKSDSINYLDIMRDGGQKKISYPSLHLQDGKPINSERAYKS